MQVTETSYHLFLFLSSTTTMEMLVHVLFLPHVVINRIFMMQFSNENEVVMFWFCHFSIYIRCVT